MFKVKGQRKSKLKTFDFSKTFCKHLLFFDFYAIIFKSNKLIIYSGGYNYENQTFVRPDCNRTD